MTTTMKARETVYAGIKMRSRLEAGFAAWLDTHKNPWTYEPCAFANGAGQYLPDFRVDDVLDARSGDKRAAYIEVKPAPPDRHEDLMGLVQGQAGGSSPNLLALARRMSVIWSSEPEALLLLAWPRMEDRGRSCCLQLCRTPFPEEMPVVFLSCLWMTGSRLAIGSTPPPAHHPWPDGYWNVD